MCTNKLVAIVLVAIATISLNFDAFADYNWLIGSYSGEPGDIIEMSLSLNSTSEDAVAAEIHIPLPEDYTISEGSFVKNDSRLPHHIVSADISNGEYVIVLYSLSLSSIPAGNGEVCKFGIVLAENPGVFEITPTIRMSNLEGILVSSVVDKATLSVLAPRIQLDTTDIDFGRVPIKGTYTRSLKAYNTGTTDLSFKEFITDVPGLTVSTEAQSIKPGDSTTLTLTYSPIIRASKIGGRLTVKSNSVGKAPFVHITSVPFSVNELHTANAEGISDTDVTVLVRMNNMEPIVGAEVTYLLPATVEYVDGSISVTPRSQKHTVTATVDSNKRLKIILFGLDNQPVEGEDGDLLSFKLRLTGTSGTYYLFPENVILANTSEENMTSATSQGLVIIKAPYLYGNNSMNLGNVSLTESNTFNYPIGNYGNAPLIINRIMFLNDIADSPIEFPVTLQPYDNINIPVRIKNPQFGSFATTMSIYSNDPNARLKNVAILGNFYSPNELIFNSHMVGDSIGILTSSLTNHAKIAALQLDIFTPVGTSIDENSLYLGERAVGHIANVSKIEENRYRIILYSLFNHPFDGNDGELFVLHLIGDNLLGKEVKVENIKLSDINGINYITPNTDVRFTTINDDPRYIELDKTEMIILKGESNQVFASLSGYATHMFPEIRWESDDESIATVDSDGNITGINHGDTAIRAIVADKYGTEKMAECAVIITDLTEVIQIPDQEKVEFYDLTGLKIPSSNNLPSGIYIRMKGKYFEKIIIR